MRALSPPFRFDDCVPSETGPQSLLSTKRWPQKPSNSSGFSVASYQLLTTCCQHVFSVTRIFVQWVLATSTISRCARSLERVTSLWRQTNQRNSRLQAQGVIKNWPRLRTLQKFLQYYNMLAIVNHKIQCIHYTYYICAQRTYVTEIYDTAQTQLKVELTQWSILERKNSTRSTHTFMKCM